MGRWVRIVGVSALILLAALAMALLTPLLDPDLTSHAQPAVSYEDAADRIATISATESELDLIPEGHSIALLTGSREATCVVVFHGYSSVPAQFELIAQAYRDQGCNVWVPRLPYHGSADKMTSDFSRLTARGLRDFADESIDIAAGLGEHVVVLGFSGGGSLAVWSGAERAEVSQTVLISPLLHPLGFAEWQDRPLVRALRSVPFDIYNWWDPEKKNTGETISGYNYPRFSLKGIAALLSLTHWADDRAAGYPYPMASPLLLVRNDGDPRLDQAYNERFATRMAPPERMTVFRIPASAELLHNIVSPAPDSQMHERIGEAYGYLSDALGIPLPDPSTTW